MKKIEMERSTFRFISELKRQISLLERTAGNTDYQALIWDTLKHRMEDIPNMKWIVKEMDSIDEFLNSEDIREMNWEVHELI